ncbi:MAG: winged helix DNA-binding protein [Nitrospira sp.]
MSYVIRSLQQNRLIRKQRSPQDDRYVLLTLTRKGMNLVRRIRAQLKTGATGKVSLSRCPRPSE